MQPRAKCLISAKLVFYVSISAWTKSNLWLFHNHRERAIPVLHAGKWPRPQHTREEGAGEHGKWTSASPGCGWGWVWVGVLACFTSLLLESQDWVCANGVLSRLLLFKMKTAKNEEVIFIISYENYLSLYSLLCLHRILFESCHMETNI